MMRIVTPETLKESRAPRMTENLRVQGPLKLPMTSSPVQMKMGCLLRSNLVQEGQLSGAGAKVVRPKVVMQGGDLNPPSV